MAYPDPYYGNTPGTYYYGGNQNMAFGLDDALAAGGGIAGGIGGVIASGQDAKQRDSEMRMQRMLALRNLAEQIREFNRTQGLAEGQSAVGLQKDIEMAPLRDQLHYALSARMGLPQQSLSYGTGGYTPTPGAGTDLAAMYNTKQAAYKPGAGGVTTDVQQQVLGGLGYGKNPTGQPLNTPPNMGTGYSDLQDYLGAYFKQYFGGGAPDQYSREATQQRNDAAEAAKMKKKPTPFTTPTSAAPRQGYAPGGLG